MASSFAMWLSPDPPVKAPDGKFMGAPWGLNPYQYVSQNPTIFWDPDGNEEKNQSLVHSGAETSDLHQFDGVGQARKSGSGSVQERGATDDTSGPDGFGTLQTLAQDRLSYTSKSWQVTNFTHTDGAKVWNVPSARSIEVSNTTVYHGGQLETVKTSRVGAPGLLLPIENGSMYLSKSMSRAIVWSLRIQTTMNVGGALLGLDQAREDFTIARNENSRSRAGAGMLTLIGTGFGFLGTSLATTLVVPMFIAPVADLLRIRPGEYSACRSNTCHEMVNDPLQSIPAIQSDLELFDHLGK
jgi:hypothetical protein